MYACIFGRMGRGPGFGPGNIPGHPFPLEGTQIRRALRRQLFGLRRLFRRGLLLGPSGKDSVNPKQGEGRWLSP